MREQNPPSATTDIHIKSDGFFCEAPSNLQCNKFVPLIDFFFVVIDIEYAHFVVQRVNNNLTESMFEINALLALCDLEYQLTQTDEYDVLCENEMSSARCCKPWSLPNYIALLSNHSSCFEIEVILFRK